MNVPKLRFYGYDDLYKNVKLSTFAQKIFSKNKGNTITNVISNSAIYGLISQRDFFDKDIANNDNTENYYIIEHGDFVYNPRKSNEAPYGPINLYKYEDAGVISPLYLCFRTKNINRNYLEYYFKSPFWYRYIYLNGDSGARHDRVSIKDETFFNMNINIPCLEEQTKVSDFLSLLDKKIELQSKKIEDLKLFKKGLIGTLKKEKNLWSEYKVSDLFTITRGTVIPKNELKDSVSDNYIYPVYSSQTSNNGILGYDKIYDFDGKYLTWTTDGANAGKVFYRNGKFRCTNVCGILYNETNLYVNELTAELLNLETPKHVSYVGNPKLMNNVMSNIKIFLPNDIESHNISNILETINKKIIIENSKLSKLNELKKGFMQNMFV